MVHTSRARRADLSLSRRIAALVMLAGVVLLGSVVVSAFAVIHLNDSVRLQVDRIDPATVAAEDLANAVINEETGTRGYVLSRDTSFLQPYDLGVSEQTLALGRLRQALSGNASLLADVSRTSRAALTWRDSFARPTITEAAAGDPAARTTAREEYGKTLFDRFRVQMDALDDALGSAHAAADARLTNADHELIALLGLCLLAVLGVFETTWILIRRWITAPIIGLATDVRQVAAGEFEHPIGAGGSPEVQSLAADVDAMRARVLSDLAEVESARGELARQSAALVRSNQDLEQFAYIASHDLQEPLRKMSSFSELVLRRYGDRLDERGHEFLTFIADAARRMQRLINDVLELSTIGRSGGPLGAVDLNDAFSAARANLNTLVEGAGALVAAKSLPTVPGDYALLTALFQNLIGNSLKFRSESPPHVVVSAERHGEQWKIAVDDNGIGVDPEYAERIFTMFQRLHRRSEFPGTGIGLALCQRIVEHHGGQIWLDTTHHPGASIVFTLPSLDGTAELP